MGQADIIEFLEKHPDEWFTVRQMAEEMDLNIKTLNVSISKLRRRHEITFKSEQVRGLRTFKPVLHYMHRPVEED